MFKVIIAGSREFKDFPLLKKKVDFLLKNKKPYVEIVSGMARGADKMAMRYAVEEELPLKKFPANWDKNGRKAGYIRNKIMGEYADALIVFWDGTSPGTLNMIKIALEQKKPIRIVKYLELHKHSKSFQS